MSIAGTKRGGTSRERSEWGSTSQCRGGTPTSEASGGERNDAEASNQTWIADTD